MKKILTLIAVVTSTLGALAQGTALTYQGRLNNGTNPATGVYDLKFFVYDAVSGGNGAGGPLTISAVGITNGLFTVALDFGGGVFFGANRWLQVEVRSNGVASFTTLAPRQQVTATPYAITAGNLTGVLPAAQLSGELFNYNLPSNPIISGTVTATAFSGNGASVTNVNAASLNGLNSSNFWRLGGNNVSSTQFLGSTNNQPLEFKVNGLRALRLEDNGDSANEGGTTPDGAPNLIAGSPQNFVGAGVVGATIAGGGATNYFGVAYTNSVLADFGVVGGGRQNTIAANSLFATIAGGNANDIAANSLSATIAGGIGNNIRTNSSYTAIGGGVDNNIAANSGYAIIAGGRNNDIGTNSDNSAIGGGDNNNIAADSGYATIAGGEDNDIGTNSIRSAIGGGSENNIAANSGYAIIAGGRNNDIGTNSGWSAIGGGDNNNIGDTAVAGTIPGGNDNNIGFNSSYGAIGGGNSNAIGGNSSYSTVGGGNSHSIGANSDYSTIGGGRNNAIQDNSEYANIPGGRANTATNLSFAAGYNAQAVNSGSFVWSDGNGTATSSMTNNSVTMRARGGYRFLTGNGGNGASLDSGATAWSVMSDRNAKKNIASVDYESVLAKLARVPIAQWNYKWEQDSDVPNLGPMAQDFKHAFYPGRDDKTISTLEFDGVALAAIQGLNEKVEVRSQKLEAENAELKRHNQTLEQRLEKLERLMIGGAK